MEEKNLEIKEQVEEIKAVEAENAEAPDDEGYIVELDNVGMEFFLPAQKIDSFKEFIIRLFKGKAEKQKHTVLENISFAIKRGESIGLIGHNGAGKSTLLKILTGIMRPTSGTVEVHGSVAPLLNLGAGFDYEATAKENVYLNAAILGYSKKEIESKYKEIVEWAELTEYMDVPLKNFSSGMVARLGFAIAMDVNPDILLVDEVLSVGDENFRKKCAEKIDELRAKGVTFVIVSHNMAQIKKLCQKAVWIEESKMQAFGDVNEVCDMYIKYCNEQKH